MVVAKKTLTTEITETLCALCVEALGAQRARRCSFWLRPRICVVYYWVASRCSRMNG